jgi:bidirectional [NiFe] hydrogenase diaphorase subunit
VQACPTGALFDKGSTVSEMERDRSRLEFIVTAREKNLWLAPD